MPLIRALAIIGGALLLAAATAQAQPAVIAPPAVAGLAQIGAPLTADPPVVEDAAADDVTLTWERSTARGFEVIADAHDATYTPTLADLGRRLRVHAAVETAAGLDEAWSVPTAPVGGAPSARLRIGPEPGAPVRLSRWTVTAGERIHVAGAIGAGDADADATVVLEPTVPTRARVEVPAAIDAAGRVQADIAPVVNAVAWLALTTADAAPTRIRLGVVGVRPRIRLVLGARGDGRDVMGHRLVRDLRLLRGSALEPGLAGLRLGWEGMLPGDRTGTAVCRTDERVTSGPGGVLRGGCRTRGAWATARWRLVLAPSSDDPLDAPFLPAASAWTLPHVGDAPAAVPALPRRGAVGPAADVR